MKHGLKVRRKFLWLGKSDFLFLRKQWGTILMTNSTSRQPYRAESGVGQEEDRRQGPPGYPFWAQAPVAFRSNLNRTIVLILYLASNVCQVSLTIGEMERRTVSGRIWGEIVVWKSGCRSWDWEQIPNSYSKYESIHEIVTKLLIICYKISLVP